MKLSRLVSMAAGLCLFAGMSAAQVDFHHFTFNVGGGYTLSTQGISTRLADGGNFQGGVGFHVNRWLALDTEFMYNQLGLTNTALTNAGVPDGNARTYSVTVDPKINIWSGEKASVYVLGGGGWLRRTVNFTQPVLATTLVYDPWFGYFGPGLVGANQTLASYSQNAGVWDVGAGINFPLPRTSVKLYLESRYMDALTNGQHTTIVPITFGIRF